MAICRDKVGCVRCSLKKNCSGVRSCPDCGGYLFLRQEKGCWFQVCCVCNREIRVSESLAVYLTGRS